MESRKEIMTKKHYELIASAMRQAQLDTFAELREDYMHNSGAKTMTMITLTNVLFEISEVFAKDNPNFDKDRFVNACMLSIASEEE